jgi:hypothetical protein
MANVEQIETSVELFGGENRGCNERDREGENDPSSKDPGSLWHLDKATPIDYLPRQLGGRFSMNARMPSRASSVFIS